MRFPLDAAATVAVLVLAGSAQASPGPGPAPSTVAPGRVVFGVGGGVQVGSGAGGAGGGASRVVGLPNGGAVLIGRSSARERGFDAAQLTPTGGLDPSFGSRGIAHVRVDSPPAVPLQVLRQPDGKLLVVVSGRPTTAFVFGQLLVVRLDADGSLDRSFGAGGVAAAPLAPACGACTIAGLAPDGDIVLTGAGGLLSAALGGDPSASPAWEVTSLTPTGGVDGSFGQGGLDTVSVAGAVGYDVGVLASGEVMTLGVASSPPGGAPISLLSLVGPDGGGDRSFNGGNPVTLPAGSGASAMLVRPDGSVVVGGTAGLFGYTSSGAPDASFGSGGAALVGPLPRPLQLLPVGGGGMLAVGRLGGLANTLTAIRVAADGTVDTTLGGPAGIRLRPGFGGGSAGIVGGGGLRVPALAQDSFAVHAVAGLPGGTYLAVGGVDVAQPIDARRSRSISDFAAASLTPAFARATGFGGAARRVGLSLSVPRQSAAAAVSRGAIVVGLNVSGAGLTRVRIRSGGRLIAASVLAVFGAGRRVAAVGLTGSGASVLRGRRGVGVTASATARDLVGESASGSASATLS